MTDLAQRLRDDINKDWNEVRGMHSMLIEENRDFTPDEKTKFENLHAAIDSKDERLRGMLADEKRERETNAAYEEFGSRRREPGTESRGEYAESVARLNTEIRSLVKKERAEVDFGYKSPMFSESRMGRSLGIDTGAAGGGLRYSGPNCMPEIRTLLENYVGGGSPGSFSNPTGAGLVPIDFYDQLISYLIEVSGIMQAGPSVLNTQGGEPLQIPYVINQTGQTTAGAQVAISATQGSTLPSADPGFGQKTLTSNKFGVLVQVARELIDDSGVNLLGYLAMSTGRAVGNMLGTSLINGTNGISGGILSAPVAITGSISTAITGSYSGAAITGAPTYANLVDMEYSVIAPYRQSRSCYWLAADKTLGLLRKLVDTVGRPVWEPSTVLGSPDLLLGKPLVADPFMPAFGSSAKSIAFGDFSQYFVRLVGGVRFERSDDFLFGSDLVAFRVVLRADGQLMNPPTAVSASQPIAVFQGGAS